MTPRGLRPSPGEDARAWTRAVFAAGDYAGAAMFGDAATMEHHAALALLKGDDIAMDALREFGSAEAGLYRGAALWIAGRTAEARRVLGGIALPHAQNLVRLIDQPRIRVLTQLPWLRNAATDLLTGAAHDPHFELRNIGHLATDLQNHPYADVGHFLDAGFAPDFYLAAMVEWHHVPPNLQALPCPIFGHLADHDLHIQTITPWLDLFDELCVTDRTEWLDVRGLTQGPVSSFPKVFGLPGNLPPVPTAERHLDFYVSGTMLDSFHPDKASLLFELLSMPDINLRVVRGFAGTMAYHALLAASKASFTYVRRAGAMPTRGLESLAMGCAVALQEECCLNLFVGRGEGIANYGPRSGSLRDAVRSILDDWHHFGRAAQFGAERVRREFAMPTAASQYLRFLTFRAAAPRSPRRMADTSTWCQKRVCIAKTWLPDNPLVRRRTMQANFRRLGQTVGKRPSAATIVDMARELLTEFAYYADLGQAGGDERAMFDDAIGLLARCCKADPWHLVARTVRIRAMLHYGDPAQRFEALQLAYDTLELDPTAWHVEATDDVMPFDFYGDLFPYRRYLDLAASARKGVRVPAVSFVHLLLASLAGYVARKTQRLDLHEVAVSLAPHFARYRLDWAKALLAAGGDAERAQGMRLLEELVLGSTEFAEAGRLLNDAAADGAAVPPAARLALRRLDEDTIDAAVQTRSLFDTERRAVVAARGLMRDDEPEELTARLSILVPDAGSDREVAALLTDLATQTMAAAIEVVLATTPEQTAIRTMATSFAGSALRVRFADVEATCAFADSLNTCVATATAPLLAIAMRGDRFRADALSRLCGELDARPETAMVMANEGWTPREHSHFDPSACVALSCLPRFGRERLLCTNGISLHPVWRRSLHETVGGFDATFGSAAEYEFWLRATQTCRIHQLPLLMVTSSLSSPTRAARDPWTDRAAAERARARHAGHERNLQELVLQRPLPAVLFAPALIDEATSHARLGILEDDERRDVCMLEHFYGTALMHGDHDTALCMLRAAAANLPHLISARLAEAHLLEALGRPGAHAVLAAASACNPYHEVVARGVRALRPLPTKPKTPEPVPCHS